MKEKLLQVTFLLATSAIKVSKENIGLSLFHGSSQRNCAQSWRREDTAGRIMLWKGNKPVA